MACQPKRSKTTKPVRARVSLTKPRCGADGVGSGTSRVKSPSLRRQFSEAGGRSLRDSGNAVSLPGVASGHVRASIRPCASASRIRI